MTTRRLTQRVASRGCWAFAAVLSFCLAVLGVSVFGASFTIDTVGGSVEVPVSHASPRGSLVSPEAPEVSGFKPPSIFSAPLPSGSGARALGLAGAFTAVADDATASSWNPGGLIQLERPEASIVLRHTRERDEHVSREESFRVGDDRFGNQQVNYFSLVYPFRLQNHNWVFALNYQEAYDFTQEFSADLHSLSRETFRDRSSGTFTQTRTQHIVDGIVEIDVTTRVTTEIQSDLHQMLTSEAVSDLDYRQEGIVDAITPALCLEIAPKLSVGAALNFYQLRPDGSGVIRSRTHAEYSGTAVSDVTIHEDSSSTGTYEFEGFADFGPPFPPMPISGDGEIPAFESSTTKHRRDVVYSEGAYHEENEFSDLCGINATFGALWTVSRHLRLGLTVDLPWVAEAEQKRTIRNTVRSYDGSRTKVIDITETSVVDTRDIELRFPLYCAVGAVWHWNNRLFSSLDVSRTQWSDFSYEAEGEARLNPLDGTPHGENRIDDCWAVRTGTEYLWVLPNTEIPFRVGFAWEQRPAVGEPDEYLSVSVGSGVSIGKDPGKLILDAAYVYTWGDDVLDTLVPEQENLQTDVKKHEVFVSSIWHF